MTGITRQTLLRAVLTAASMTLTTAADAQNRNAAANYTCEGTAASIVSNDFTGDQRQEWPISFGVNVNRSAGSVMIYRVSGTQVIKAGRHVLAADRSGRMAMSWNWTDQSNQSQIVTMTISRSGEFEGAWSQSNPLDRTPFGGMLHMSIKGSFSGVCYQ